MAGTPHAMYQVIHTWSPPEATFRHMLVLELIFTSTPERLAARPAHRAILAELHRRGDLVAAGPWDDDGGALLIFDVEPDVLDQIMEEDPYYATPGVRVAGIRPWSPVVAPASVLADDADQPRMKPRNTAPSVDR